ncbi:copper resistance protein CopC [Meiothermus sp. QL-1]|uniref:copper resistance CopC family protein n=1 Tax=Meiothermus sp. QL-1 TaxID=2058095 RepID=UPI000E09E36B|nr:copper resistance CopC family protein [Meiothermus sp. QL-1]RDI94883.1 copper resistance protein CopC [Meiothermus sp. QL-1]
MKRLLLGVIPALAGMALAHAYLVSSSPPENARLEAPPTEVRLGFTEAVVLPFSLFRVYRLEAPGNPRQAAEALAARVLARREDPPGRVDLGLKTQGRSAENVVLALEPGLRPGVYVVVWRVLSVDTHVTSGFYLFTYQPPGGRP